MQMWCKRTVRFTPVLGQDVAVCYDGKHARAQRGKVVEVHRRKFVVEFLPYANEEVGLQRLTVVRHRRKRGAFGGWLIGPGENLLMSRLLGCPGDWYSVFPVGVLEIEADI